ncbi:MAG TPA: phage tail protein [Chthoniobacterales bacterium]
MDQLSSDPQRADPYKNFKFRLSWEGRYVAGFSEVSGLTEEISVVDYREGQYPISSHKAAERIEYEVIELERGVTYDSDFKQWASKICQYECERDVEVPLKDIRIDRYNEKGEITAAHTIHRCRVSEFHARPELDAATTSPEIRRIKLEHEGWEREK